MPSCTDMPGDRRREAKEAAAPAMQDVNPELVIVGRISGLYGVQGWVRVFSHTAPRASILNYSPWYLQQAGRWEERTLNAGRVHGKGIVAQLEGCSEREQAVALMGAVIAVRRDQLPAIAPGEFYWTDLEGLRVRTREGIELGVIDHLFETGANDVVVVKGERERLIPYIWKDVICSVDLEAGLMIVDWDPEF